MENMETTIMGYIGSIGYVGFRVGMEKKMEIIVMGYIGATIRILANQGPEKNGGAKSKNPTCIGPQRVLDLGLGTKVFKWYLHGALGKGTCCVGVHFGAPCLWMLP